MAQAEQPHLIYGYKWVLFKDVHGILKTERTRHDAAGDHFIGYPYIDHQTGFSTHVHLFCKVNFLGNISKTADLDARKVGLILRYDVMSRCEMKPLADHHINALGLAPQPEYLELYENKQVAPLRTLEFLHPLRAPGFPDDIKFALVPQNEHSRIEEVWGRLERRLSEFFYECTLLNQPHQDFGIHAGDRVVVMLRAVPGGTQSQFMGPLSAFQEMIDNTPPYEGE